MNLPQQDLLQLDLTISRDIMREKQILPYTTDEGAAARLRDRLELNGWSYYAYELPNGVRAVFSRGIGLSYAADAPTRPLATVLAALKAHRIEKEPPPAGSRL